MDTIIILTLLMRDTEPRVTPVARAQQAARLTAPLFRTPFNIGSWHSLGVFLSCPDEQQHDLCLMWDLTFKAMLS